MKYILAILLICNTSFATDGYTLVSNQSLQSQHDWDHIGNSFLVQTVSYGLYRKVAKLDKWDAVLFSMATTFIFTSVYSLNTGKPKDLGRDIGMNMIGAGLSAGTCIVFDF